jgi:type IV secretion system protein VirD4
MALLAAVTSVVARLPPAERKVSKVFEYLLADDAVYNLAVLLDTLGKEIPRSAYREIAAFLQMPDITRGGVLATTLSYLKTLHSPSVLRSLEETTFSLPDFIAGRPMTIYFVLPVDKLHSHRSVLKLWIGTLLKAIVSRTHRPEQRTLLMIDECGQLGHFPFLETFITLCRGFSCSVWTCWQDLEQLKAAYPASWKTLLNNCGILQAFGFTNRDLTEQWSTYLETSPGELRALARDEAIVSIAGQGDQRVRMLNYLRDREFEGQFDENPLYASWRSQTPHSAEAAIPPIPELSRPPRRRRSGGDTGEGGIGARQS